ncbi:MAG: glycosyltransferase family 39 protein [Actinobacteria bacterium]|nr:glycosyltransferase family 39 protein [Actinomycetota bacterium]
MCSQRIPCPADTGKDPWVTTVAPPGLAPIVAPEIEVDAPTDATVAGGVTPVATTHPGWARVALGILLVATGALYLWGLGASGWANSFYSAAAQAGSASWKAWFFGASDAAGSITVDKPPVALWVMGLSARIFGVNAWSILVPQALMGVASVGVLYATVRRWFGPVAGLVAGAVLATTPIATLMFRFNNPDPLLVLLSVCAVWCLVRALETTATRWVVATWALVGCGFLTKMLQAFLVAPAFALVYLVLADTRFRRRFVQSVIGLVTLVVSAGWYIAVVEIWPKSSRPFIGGSQHNSLIELTLGYNGFGRLTGSETGSANNGGRWGATGLGRLFNNEFGSQAAWLIPAALILFVAGLWWTLRAPRTDRTRAALLIWGGWLLVTGATFSFGQGIIHPYYTVALAPAVGALVGIGGFIAWQRRSSLLGRLVLAVSIATTAIWSHALLRRSADWTPWLAPIVLVGGVFAAALVLFAPHLRGRIGVGVAAIVCVLGLAAPTAFSLQTASTPHSGALPTAGPSQGRGGFGGRGFGRFGPPGGFGPRARGFRFGGNPNAMFPGTGFPPPGAFGGGNFPPPGMFGSTNGSRRASAGGLLDGSRSTPAITAMLKKDAASYRWVAATVGSNSAAGFQLATLEPVMPIGGFNGSDPSPTLQQFKGYVADRRIHYFIGGGFGMGGGFGGGRGGTSTSSEIRSWVTQNFPPTTVDGVTLYDLTRPIGTSGGSAG